jgi:hypothetical protein
VKKKKKLKEDHGVDIPGASRLSLALHRIAFFNESLSMAIALSSGKVCRLLHIYGVPETGDRIIGVAACLGEEGGLTSTISSRPRGSGDVRDATGSVPAGKNVEAAIDARPSQEKGDVRLS